MPNWCENTLSVSGDKKQIEKFIKFAEGNDGDDDGNELSFNKFIPYPEKYAKQDREAHKLEEKVNAMPEAERDMFYALHGHISDGYNSGGHQWCVSNWGTKWGACHLNREICADNSVVYYFDTAWSPPGPVIKAMIKRFPELCFDLEFREEGTGFKGEAHYVGGEGNLESWDIPPNEDDETDEQEAV